VPHRTALLLKKPKFLRLTNYDLHVTTSAMSSYQKAAGPDHQPQRTHRPRLKTNVRAGVVGADAAGQFALDINGANAGFLKKFSGLAMEAD
jgi:hypothetical protein